MQKETGAKEDECAEEGGDAKGDEGAKKKISKENNECSGRLVNYKSLATVGRGC